MAPKEPVIEQRAGESQHWKQGAARALRRKRRADWLQYVRQGGALGFADWGVAFQDSEDIASRSQPPTAPWRSARLQEKQSWQQLRRPSQTLAPPPWRTAAWRSRSSSRSLSRPSSSELAGAQASSELALLV